MTDPRFRTLYPSLEAAGKPVQADGFYIAVEIGRDWIQDYISKDGKWMAYGSPYVPATQD